MGVNINKYGGLIGALIAGSYSTNYQTQQVEEYFPKDGRSMSTKSIFAVYCSNWEDMIPDYKSVRQTLTYLSILNQ